MNIKAIITIVVFVLFCIFSMIWYQEKVICNCAFSAGEDMKKDNSQTDVPYYFKGKNNNELVTTEKFNKFADSIKNQVITNDKKIQIKGFSLPGEDTSVTNNAGLIRAKKLKEKLIANLPDKNIEIISEFLKNPDSTLVFTGAIVELLSNVKSTENKLTQSVLEKGVLTIIFPPNSVNYIIDKQTEQRLNELIKLAKEGNKTIVITGHTDNIGSSNANLEFGFKRANSLKDKLIQLGIRKEQVKTESKGMEKPLASNDTPEGRAKNRRVEIKFE